MANNKMNQDNLKSVSGRGPAPTTQNVEKAKAIVKEELKKESLSRTTGAGPYPTTGANAPNKDTGKGGKESLQAGALKGVVGTGPVAVNAGGASGTARPTGASGLKNIGTGSSATPPVCITPEQIS